MRFQGTVVRIQALVTASPNSTWCTLEFEKRCFRGGTVPQAEKAEVSGGTDGGDFLSLSHSISRGERPAKEWKSGISVIEGC